MKNLLFLFLAASGEAFVISSSRRTSHHPQVAKTSSSSLRRPLSFRADDDGRSLSLQLSKQDYSTELVEKAGKALCTLGIGGVLSLTCWTNSLMLPSAAGDNMLAFAEDTTTTTSTTTRYDGFADYAKENQMEQSDVGCFMNKCGDQTKALFSNPRGIKGVSCLGRCKGEQTCAVRCFAAFGSEDLNNWLSCTIEDNECVKVPKNIDNSAEDVGYSSVVRSFDPKSLLGKWYKTDGLNPNYDLFPCQYNSFVASNDDNSELDMGIFFRIQQTEDLGGGFWDNSLKEHMVVDAVQTESVANPSGRTMHTEGKMNGLTFNENWFILGESDGTKGIPEFKLVAYKGHTLQGNYEGSFVYAKTPKLDPAAVPAVREAASKSGLDFDKFTKIDNTCPAGEPLNDRTAGTGTSTTDWVDLVVGEGGVVDWVFPGWRGEYKQ